MGEVDLEVLDLVGLLGGSDAEGLELGGVTDVCYLGLEVEAELLGGSLLHKELVRSEADNIGEIHQSADVDIISLAGEETVDCLLGGVKLRELGHLL